MNACPMRNSQQGRADEHGMTLRLVALLAASAVAASACTSEPMSAPTPAANTPNTTAPATVTTKLTTPTTTKTQATTLDPAPDPISITTLLDGYDALVPDERPAPNEVVSLASSTCQTMAQSQHANQIRYIFAKQHGETVGHAVARLLVSFGCPKYLPQFD